MSTSISVELFSTCQSVLSAECVNVNVPVRAFAFVSVEKGVAERWASVPVRAAALVVVLLVGWFHSFI